MFDGAEVNEAEVLAWIAKELATNEVKTEYYFVVFVTKFCNVR